MFSTCVLFARALLSCIASSTQFLMSFFSSSTFRCLKSFAWRLLNVTHFLNVESFANVIRLPFVVLVI